MNAGAYGGEMKDVLESVLVLTEDFKQKMMTPEELELSYRHSSLMENGGYVLSAVIKLQPGDKSEIKAKIDETDIGSVKVKVSMPETEISAIQAHTPTLINVEAVGKTFSGGTIEKGVQADPLTHSYDVRIAVSNSDRKLLPGMVASVQFAPAEPQHSHQLPTVPVTAVQSNGGAHLFVWTVDNDSTAHRTAVSVGETIGNRIVLSEGVDDGQRIITEGYQKLSEGTKVIF